MPVVVTELADPLTVRRTVALSTAVSDGRIDVEGMIGRVARDPDEAVRIAFSGDVGVVVSPELPPVNADVVVDARLAKTNIDTTIDDARFVVGLGPGFSAGIDCHAVVETLRGPRLGRVIWAGPASADTGTPGQVGTRDVERVLRAPLNGVVRWQVAIGDAVAEGEVLGHVDDAEVVANFDGVARGLIRDGIDVAERLKIGDIDPRPDTACDEISDKALAVGGGALEAVLTWSNRSL